MDCDDRSGPMRPHLLFVLSTSVLNLDVSSGFFDEDDCVVMCSLNECGVARCRFAAVTGMESTSASSERVMCSGQYGVRGRSPRR